MEIEQANQQYFKLARENVFLHLNKTVLLHGEDIWFAAYVLNQNSKKPNVSTSNLDVGLYNAEGKLLDSQVLRIDNGNGSGMFLLDNEKYGHGKYTLRATTAFMKNFKEDLSANANFEILPIKTTTEEKSIGSDLQLMAESGHLLASISNTIGVKYVNAEGKGIPFKAEVFSADDKIIKAFDSNSIGLVSFKFIPMPNNRYHIKIKADDGTTLEKYIMQANLMGIVLSANTAPSNKAVFNISTNEESFDSVKNRTYYLALHQDRNMRILSLPFSDVSPSNTIEVKTDDLYLGINIVTLFDDGFKPIAERLIYNYQHPQDFKLKETILRKTTDSLEITFSSENSNTTNYLSASILPRDTKAYKPGNNILSAVYIQPYIKGNVENGDLYFNEATSRGERRKNIDLLMLTQGWSAYDWENVFNRAENNYEATVDGFTVKGKLKDRNNRRQTLLLITSQNGNIKNVTNINSDDFFIFENLPVVEGQNLTLGIIDNKTEKITEPSIASIEILKANETSLKNIPLSDYLKKKSLKGIANSEFLFNLDASQLDTVMLTGKIYDIELKSKSQEIFYKEKKIDQNLERSFQYLSAYIRSKVFE